jgi:hypothetical protein
MSPVPRKKEIGVMRIGVVVFIAAFMLTACVHLDVNKTINALKKIQPGDSQEVVFESLGPPGSSTGYQRPAFCGLLSDKSRGFIR